MIRRYIGTVRHGGGFGGGYGGTYSDEIEFKSRYRAGSRANADDCAAAYRRRHGRAGWIDVESVRLAKRDDD